LALLEATTAMPMLRRHRRSLDVSDQPIEVVDAIYRGDRVAFEALLTDRERGPAIGERAFSYAYREWLRADPHSRDGLRSCRWVVSGR
jgi:hypothetical protein